MGFIGFGEAPRYIAGGLSKERARLLAYDVQAGDDTPRARTLRRRAEETGVTLVKSLEELLSAADVVLNFTSADAAAPIAHLAAPLLKERKTYLDMNSTSPGTKQALADIFSDSAGDFVEAAVMSSVPAGGARVPISLCGKTGAEVSARLNALGMNTTFLGEEIGQACLPPFSHGSKCRQSHRRSVSRPYPACGAPGPGRARGMPARPQWKRR